MDVSIDQATVTATLDVLLGLWQRKEYPYTLPDAVIPQTILPEHLRKNPVVLARFYFYACIYMRGGIQSLQAFRALTRLYEDRPELFDPAIAEQLLPGYVESILAKYVGWDARNAAINWVENSRRLMASWGGNPLNLMKGLTSYNEALRRIRNKRTKRDRVAAGSDGHGFRGFQPKMVSMLLYFFDWEGWLDKHGTGRFAYPSPADFHNFRIGFNQEAILLAPMPKSVRVQEKISAAWRQAIMRYIKERHADPVEVADALWLFSLTVCGNSPLTQTRSEERPLNGSGMYSRADLPHTPHTEIVLTPKNRARILATCGRCPLETSCRYAVPANHYYQRGKGKGGILRFENRPSIQELFGKTFTAPVMRGEAPAAEQLVLFGPDE